MDGTSVFASHAHPNRASEANTPRHKNGKIKWQKKFVPKGLVSITKPWNIGTFQKQIT